MHCTLAETIMRSLNDARALDAKDTLKHLRDEFHLVRNEKGEPLVYMCGNSLGLQPKRTQVLVQQELQVWMKKGVEGHFDHEFGRPWVNIEETVVDSMARIVGARTSEVAVMGSLTANLHHLMSIFYRPTPQRCKIMIEDKAFPSDQYAVASQIQSHGYNPEADLIVVKPRPGEYTLRTKDIVETIETHGSTVALILFSGVQYYTGQFFDMEAITKAGHDQGCIVGFDLAHAVGNVPLRLHDWNVDFAAWCSYKYLNSGPGGIAGLFVHDRCLIEESANKLSGWWGHNRATRFAMPNDFDPIPGASALQLSNPSVMTMVCLRGSLDVFDQTTMDELRAKSLKLTAWLEQLLQDVSHDHDIRIITPADPHERGCQLSILFGPHAPPMDAVHKDMLAAGVICDERKPDCIRLAPVPLYNTFEDVWKCVHALRESLEKYSS